MSVLRDDGRVPWWAIPRPTKKVTVPLLLVLIALLGIVHLLIRTSRYGAFIQGDAAFYLKMAAGLPTRNDGHYPPGYSLLMAATGRAVGVDLREAARLLNVAAFGSTLLAAGFWLRRYAKSGIVTCVAALILAASVPLNYYASTIHSEALFTLFLLFALICIGESIREENNGEGRVWWVSASVFAALASVTRYAGVTVIAASVLVILLAHRALLIDRLKNGMLFGAVSSIPLAAVLAYNAVSHGSMVGRHRLLPTGEQDWAIPRLQWWLQEVLNAPDWFPWLLALAAFALAAAGGWMTYVRRTSSRSMSSFDWTPAIPFLVFAAVYGVAVLTAASMVTFGSKARYLAMLYAPVLLSAAILVDRFMGMKAAGPRAAAAKWAVVSLMAAGGVADAVLSARTNLRLTAEAVESGRSEAYNNAQWEASETLDYIRANPPGRRIFSNYRDALFLIDSPASWATYASGRFERLRTQVEQEADGAAIVWFTEAPDWYPEYGPAEIGELPGVESVVKLSDGVVYYIGR